jgi:acetoin utilization protein AcuB
MFVNDYMTRHPVMVEPDMSVLEAQGIMAETKVRHLPVVEKGKRLAGLITRQSLRIAPTELGSLNVWEISRYLSHLSVKDVMVQGRDVISVQADATLEEAAQLMAEHKIGCLPVLEEGIVVGIITEIDLLVELAVLLGGTVSGVRATMRVPDKIGEFAKVTSAIASRGWGIYASGGVPAPKDPGYWHFVVKVRNVSKADLVAVLETIEDQEIVDVREVHKIG